MKIIENYKIFLQIDKSYSFNTIKTYLYNLNVYMKFLEEKKINYINAEYADLSNFLNYLKTKYNHKSKSINTYISFLKSFYGYLLKENYIKYNPSSLLSSPKIEKKLPTYLTNDELKMIFSSIDSSKKNGKRDYLIIKLLYDTGVRVSELINIKINHIDFENRCIKILGKGNKERLVYFTNSTYKLLNEYINYDLIKHDKVIYLFPGNSKGYITRNEIYNLIKKYANEAGIEKNVTPHVLRHTFATQMIKNDADILAVKTILGHSKLSTTQIYTHLNKKDLKKKYDEIKERE